MLEEGREHYPRETGGILMGRWESALVASVNVLIGAGPDATHERYLFRPDHSWQKQAMVQLYEQSGRMLEYLGDWHTHPGEDTSPSRRDVATARLIRDHRRARAPRPVMLIMAISDDEQEEPVPYFLHRRLRRGHVEIVDSKAEIWL